MIEISVKSECCGCYGCINICTKKCIHMKIDSEGFWYPEVDKSECIGCNLCEKVCPSINSQIQNKFEKIAYACKNKNEEVRLNSSSGGVFSCLCKYVISNKGIVFGAAFNEDFEVEHIEAKTLEESCKLRGSKYVQSKIGETFESAKLYLDKGKMVLFSGTQCQIKGLNLFLRKEYKNLICVDIVCHGVPSPLVLEMYKDNLVRKYKSSIKNIEFRDKSKGWKKFSYVTDFENGEKYSNTLNDDIYIKGFLNNLYLRPSCYHCKSKNFTNKSDISLADYWGVQERFMEFDDDKGISLVLVNSQKGLEVFKNITDSIEFKKADLDHAIYHNPCIIKPVKYNTKRQKFFKKLKSADLEETITKNITHTLLQRIKNKALYEVSKIIG